jgi:hypothetical protein
MVKEKLAKVRQALDEDQVRATAPDLPVLLRSSPMSRSPDKGDEPPDASGDPKGRNSPPIDPVRVFREAIAGGQLEGKLAEARKRLGEEMKTIHSFS